MRENRSLPTEPTQIREENRNGIGTAKGEAQPNTRMKPNPARRRKGGFTGWDLLICVVTATLVIGFLLMPRPTGCGAKASRINCVSNLKQIGLAFRMWSNDHGNRFPMALPVSGTNGGTVDFNLTGEVWRHFQIISNEINTPKVFVCPDDGKRSRTGDWSVFTNNSHLSYFVGLDADETMPQTILSGDRNVISPTIKPVKGVLNFAANDRVEWTKAIHKQQGNVGLGDGSAAQLTQQALSKQFQAAFNSTTQAVYRIALPE
jgi:hypothetical protein